MSTIVIEELEGRRRTLTLVGPALPFRGATWGGEMRLVTTFPPGKGGEATQQILGDTEAPSEWEGTWNTTRMISAPSTLRENGQDTTITRAFTLMTAFEDIARSGALLRVTWATQNRKISREGRVGARKFPIDREDDIRWSATFVWVSRGTGNETSLLAQASENVEASMRAMLGTVTDLQSAIVGAPVVSTESTIPGSTSFITLGQLEQIAQAPRVFVQGVSDTAANLRTSITRSVGVIETARSQPSEVADIAATSARQTKQELLDVQKRLSRIPPEVQVDAGTPISGVARSAAYFWRIGAKNDAAIAQSLKTEGAARKRVRAGDATRGQDQARAGDVIATIYARAGDTFAGLAAKYYGSADLGPSLAKANGLPAYQVAPAVGMRIIVPRVSAQDGPAKAS